MTNETLQKSVANRDNKALSPYEKIRKSIGANLKKIDSALPLQAGMSPENIASQALLVIANNPGLQNCTPDSVVGAIMFGCQMGLSFSPKLGQAWLVPRKNRGVSECQFQFGYKAFVLMALKSGMVKDIFAQVVYEGDGFSYEYGTSKSITHKPCKFSERGELEYVYAIVEYMTGGRAFVVLEKDEVHARRDANSWNGKISDPWKKHPAPMWRKTAINAITSFLPLSATTQNLMADNSVITPESFDSGKLNVDKATDEWEFDDIEDAETVDTETGEVLEPKFKYFAEDGAEVPEGAKYATKEEIK